MADDRMKNDDKAKGVGAGAGSPAGTQGQHQQGAPGRNPEKDQPAQQEGGREYERGENQGGQRKGQGEEYQKGRQDREVR